MGGFVATVSLLLLALVDALVALARGWLPLGAGRLLVPALAAAVLVCSVGLAIPFTQS